MRTVIRTPEKRFKNLVNYQFSPNYINIDTMRMHYVDEGNPEADPVLMLHGEPTWSYLYRHMIPVCAAAGHRVIAPDLIGFGKSDKIVETDAYSYQAHMDWITAFINKLDLNNITLVCQDWGSLIGLRLAAENQSRFKAIVVGNGVLPTGDDAPPLVFKLWRMFSKYTPILPISTIVNIGSKKRLSADEKKAYDAPFPSEKYKAGARIFPQLVPITPDDPATEANRKALDILGDWHKPFLTTFSTGDPIMRGFDVLMRDHVPGSKGLNHLTLRGGHFLQEDSGTEMAQAVNDLLKSID